MTKPLVLLLLLVSLSALFFSNELCAEEKYTFIVEKQKEKAKNRWSLSEWLEKRDHMRLMDLWLAMHSPSPYEFYLTVNHQMGSFPAGGYYGGWDFSFTAFTYLFGLEVQRQENNLAGAWVGLGHVRVFGLHAQATNLTFSGGAIYRKRGGEYILNPLAAAAITLYFNPAFGMEGHYRHAFAAANLNGKTLSSHRWQGGAFLDFKFFRVNGGYSWELEEGTLASSPGAAYLGAKLFF